MRYVWLALLPLLVCAEQITLEWDNPGWTNPVEISAEVSTDGNTWSVAGCQPDSAQTTLSVDAPPKPRYFRVRALEPDASAVGNCDVSAATLVSNYSNVASQLGTSLQSYTSVDVDVRLPWVSEGGFVTLPVFEAASTPSFVGTGGHSSHAHTHGLTIDENDLLVLVVQHDPNDASVYGNPTVTGFTEAVRNETNPTSSSNEWGQIVVLYKIAGASEASSYTVNFSENQDDSIVTVLRYSNVDTADPIPTTAVIDSGNFSSTSIDIPAITTQYDNSKRVAITGRDGVRTNVSPADTTFYSSWGASLVERVDYARGWCGLGIADVDVVTAGAQSATTVTAQESQYEYAISLEIKGAAAAAVASLPPQPRARYFVNLLQH